MRSVRVELFGNDDLLYRFANEAGPKGRVAATRDALYGVVDAVEDPAHTRVTFAGSDPLEHPDFPDVFERCVERGFAGYRLITDGFGLVHEPVREFLKGRDVELLVVFPASDERFYAPAMRTRARFESCRSGLELAAAAGLEPHVVVSLHRFAAGGIDDTLGWLDKHAIAGALVDYPDVRRASGVGAAGLLDYRDAAALTARIFASNRRSRRVSGFAERWAIPPCGADGALDDYGDLFNQRNRHLRARGRDRLVRVAACQTCDLASACGGVESDYVERFGESQLRPIPLVEANGWYTKPINRLDEVSYQRVSPYESRQAPGTLGLLRINGHCNMGCSFCFVDLSHPDEPIADLRAELDALAASGVTELVVSGGEPTLHPNLPDVLRYARTLPFQSIELQSNGVKLANRDFAAEVVDAGIDIACLSLHSHRAEESDRITKRPKAFARTVQAVHNLRDLGVWTRFAHVINRLNYREVPEFVQFVRTEYPTGKLDICFAIAQEISGQTSTWILPTFSEIRPYVKEALDFCLENDIGFSGLIGQGSYPPCMLDGDLKYYERVMHQVYRSANRSEWYKAPRCEGCSFNEHCVGVRRSYVDTYGDDELVPF
ncbi:MAG: radical SAM protein [Myxococcales bacterium]|nr:radical SAM protein [Myxococcales bacterium]MCB9520021.1 radical SAM protein [Myxococcales bacterium]